MNLRRTSEHLLAQASEILKRDGRYAPLLFVYGQQDDVVILLELSNIEEKYRAMRDSGRRFAGIHPVAVAFVCETWMSDFELAMCEGTADNPDRQEILAVAVQTRRLRTRAAAVPFIRLAEEIIFGEPVYGAEGKSVLLEEFWRGVIDGEVE